MERGQRDTRTSRLLDQLGPEGPVGEKVENGLNKAENGCKWMKTVQNCLVPKFPSFHVSMFHILQAEGERNVSTRRAEGERQGSGRGPC